MTPQTTLDLGYADPPPPPDLAARARARGRSLRRRRQTGFAGAAVALVAVVSLGVHSFSGASGPSTAGPADRSSPSVSQQALSKLPASIGNGPAASHFTSGGWSAGEYRQGHDVGGGPISPIIRLDQDSSPQPLMWISRNASLCLGERASTTATLETSVCRPLRKLPAEGLWGGTVWSLASGAPDDAKHPIRSYIVGLVRGPASRVVIDLPTGPQDAHLQSIPGQGLGRLYWLATDNFTMAGTALGSGDTARNVQHGFPTGGTVYRGDTPVFHCSLDACIGSDD